MNMHRRTTLAGAIRRAGFRNIAALALASITALGIAPVSAQAPGAPAAVAPGTVFDVKPGDSFGRIAARVTGNVAQWRQLYHPQKSGLPNPNLIQIGSQLELVKEAEGGAYLRLRAAATARAPAPVVAVAQAATNPAAAKPAPAAPVSTPAPARMPETLTIGVLPFIPTPILMAQNEPLKNYLERNNRNKVNVVTAPNFRAFFEGTMKGDYDLSVTGSHLARVGQLDGGMVPIAIYEPRIRALLIGAKEGGIKSAKDMKGKAVVYQNPQSLVAMHARQWLQKQDLQAERDFEVKAARTDIGVGRMILTGEAAGAFMSNGEFRSIPAADAERLVIVEQVVDFPNFVVLAHPRLGAAVIQTLRSQFHAFASDSVDGAAFTKATGVVKIVDADARQMAELDPFVEQTRRAMGLVK